MQIAIPIPTPDESLERFTIRAHRQLADAIADPDQRNEVVWSQWAKHRGATEEEQLAGQTFVPERFVRKSNVCVFGEHETLDGNGNPIRYDLPEIVRITRGCNHRIADFSGFAPLSDGHTPDPIDSLAISPDILGYAGPYRLGMIGRKNPRWAIFADEWHMKECADRLAAKPRRSVELWKFKNDPTRTHFDPVAAIGAETPRLPLPFKFSRQFREGALVERYTFDASSFVSPGAGNTFVKKFSREESMALSNDDISQLIAALMQTPQFQYLDQCMKANQPVSPSDGGAAAGQVAGGDAAAGGGGDAAAGGSGGGGSNDLADLNDLLTVEDDEPSKNMAGGYGPMKHTRAAAANSNGKGQPAQGEVVEKYTRLQSAHNRLVQEHGQSLSRMVALERRAVDSDRTAAIVNLSSKYDGFVDVDDELSRTLYSRGANLGDDAFRNHVATVEKYAQKAVAKAREFAPDLPGGVADYGTHRRGDDEKYQASLSAEAVRIHTRAVNAGKYMTYDEAVSEAEKSLGSRAAAAAK